MHLILPALKLLIHESHTYMVPKIKTLMSMDNKLITFFDMPFKGSHICKCLCGLREEGEGAKGNRVELAKNLPSWLKIRLISGQLYFTPLPFLSNQNRPQVVTSPTNINII